MFESINLSNLSKLKFKITKRGIQVSLGLLWLLDGFLQLQHQMFSSAFATQVIAPAGQGQPIAVYGPINFEIHMLLLHPALFDAVFAVIQLGLGVLILNRKTIKIGLLASVVWALGVWYMGEGLGGLLSGQTSLLQGAPGAALIYAILALAVLPAKNSDKKTKQNKPAYWLSAIWGALWILGAIYQLLPGQNTASDVASTISANTGGSTPGWLSSLDFHTANFINGKGFIFVLILALIQLAVGLTIFMSRRLRNASLAIGITLSVIFWFVGQSLGGYFTGLATDPDTAPLFILLAFAIMGSKQFSFSLLKSDLAKYLKLPSRQSSAKPVLNSLRTS